MEEQNGAGHCLNRKRHVRECPEPVIGHEMAANITDGK
jgi:hypothetical protein